MSVDFGLICTTFLLVMAVEMGMTMNEVLMHAIATWLHGSLNP